MARILKQEPVIIYGDGSQTRDFVYVGDLAELIARVVTDETLKNRVVNAGSGVQTSIADVVQACGRVLGVQPRLTHKPQEGGERGLFEADMTLCRTLFGGLPSTALEDGLQRTAAWFTESFGTRVQHG
jgi:UDP-glucose 4-epimerase